MCPRARINGKRALREVLHVSEIWCSSLFARMNIWSDIDIAIPCYPRSRRTKVTDTLFPTRRPCNKSITAACIMVPYTTKADVLARIRFSGMQLPRIYQMARLRKAIESWLHGKERNSLVASMCQNIDQCMIPHSDKETASLPVVHSRHHKDG